MIEAIATVIGYQSGQLTVEAFQKSSCDHCTQPECGSGQVSRALNRRYHQLTLPYAQPLEPGTRVMLALPESGLLSAAGLMFLLPLLSLLLFVAVGEWLFTNLLGAHELWSVIMALLGGGVGFSLARHWHKRLSKKGSLEPSVVRVLLGCEEVEPFSNKR